MEEVGKKDDVSDKDDKDDKRGKSSDKVFFVQRLFAYLIDVFLIAIVISLISTPFNNEKETVELNKQTKDLLYKYSEKDISDEEFVLKYADLSYKVAKNESVITFVGILAYIAYFVMYQIYNNGQTIGKKIFKIKVVSNDGDLTMNQMIFRSFLSNSILLNLITFVLLIFLNKSVYFYGVEIFALIQYSITFISIFMVMYSKDGKAIHDRLFHTQVVKV